EIKYALPVDASVSLKVFDIFGREVATLVFGNKVAGYYSVSFDASKLSSGMYFYKLTAGSFVEVKKLVVMK
ncbi:MAG: T9SS type A sorting domain-containing protein, partial [Ignavibacteriales bacterium]|nr:T9SS type A sorting domain-containing protein [Ignavibacteriales bacterium]